MSKGQRGQRSLSEIRRATLAAPLLSVDVKYKELFRGTTTLEILKGFGKRWKLAGTLDGQDVQDLHHVSEVVTHLDDFLSHSWRDEWWKKYLALVCIYNLNPALILGYVISFLIYLMSRNSYLPPMGHIGLGMGLFPNGSGCPPFSSWCLLGGCTTFVFLLGAWQHVVWACHAIIGWPQRRLTFFDRICIDQKNDDHKTKAVADLGGYLAHSDRMVTFWSGVYFSRLWCVFELATFIKIHIMDDRGASLLFLPLPLIEISFIGFVLFMAGVFGLEIFLMFMPGAPANEEFVATLLVCGVSALNIANVVLIGSKQILEYTNNRQKMEAQVSNFDVREAECFDPKDKKRVHHTILRWYGIPKSLPDQLDGLDHFNNFVRDEFLELVEKNIGKPAEIPYKFVALAVFPLGMIFLDYAAALARDEEITNANPDAEIVWLLAGVSMTFAGMPLIVRGILHWFVFISPLLDSATSKLTKIAVYASIWTFASTLVMVMTLLAYTPCNSANLPAAAIVCLAYSLLAWRVYMK